MGFLKLARSSASSFLSSWMKDGDAVPNFKTTSLKPAPAQIRLEAKRTWSIRKQEFDKLRKLRQNEILNDENPRQRFSPTSRLTDLSEKTSTIKKIDEIEAQMSMQWWKTDRLNLDIK